MFDTIVKVFWISLGYFIAALYFDNVFAANRGTSKHWMFFLSPRYWLSYCRLSKVAASK